MVSESVLLNFAASLCVHIDGGKMLHREEMHRRKPGGPQRYIMFLERDPLGKEGGIRGQTEEGCLPLADTWAPWGAVQLPSHGLTED